MLGGFFFTVTIRLPVSILKLVSIVRALSIRYALLIVNKLPKKKFSKGGIIFN